MLQTLLNPTTPLCRPNHTLPGKQVQWHTAKGLAVGRQEHVNCKRVQKQTLRVGGWQTLHLHELLVMLQNSLLQFSLLQLKRLYPVLE